MEGQVSKICCGAQNTQIVLQPIKDISGTIMLPGSKSLSNQILLLAALSEGTIVVDNLLNSDDIHYMLSALRTLGISVLEGKAVKKAIVEGCGGLLPMGKESRDEVQLFLGNFGTAMQPLTAAGGNSSYILDGMPRMRERPIEDLVDGLKQLGADIGCFLGTKCPPVCVFGNGGLPGDKFQHFVKSSYTIESSKYFRSLRNAYVEGDASSASYFLACAAVTVEGCGTSSLQGDVKFAEVLEKMGC
ncbi:3-phosphoshikimate 1-carboxyvinyltransferase [Quercus suber]|uniref:3-phosphoshikimate 1-carboxyvinyltransferase n=1 Tax=Quercus suber TaxID=58331 RepID=A0AAW0KDI8_QUESU